MRRGRKARLPETNGEAKKVLLGQLSEGDRQEYLRRHQLVKNAMAALEAANFFASSFESTIREAYHLPTRYELDLDSGAIYSAHTNPGIPVP